MTSVKQAIELISKGTDEVLIEEELEKKLDSGKKLNIKAGFDPTAPDSIDLLVIISTSLVEASKSIE